MYQEYVNQYSTMLMTGEEELPELEEVDEEMAYDEFIGN
jgi:hypothetical protein